MHQNITSSAVSAQGVRSTRADTTSTDQTKLKPKTLCIHHNTPCTILIIHSEQYTIIVYQDYSTLCALCHIAVCSSALQHYRANPKVSWNPNFCVGCFELIISKNFAAASKMGKNGQNFFLRFFCGTHFCVGCWAPKKNLRFFFCVLGIGVDSFCCYCKKLCVPWTLGLQSILTQAYKCPLQSIAQISTNKHGSGLPVFQQTSSKYPCPELAPLSALGHINSRIQISMSRTSPFICFGAYQQPHSTILTLVTIPDASFSESKARCRTGHKTPKRGTKSSWANSPASLAFLQKGGQGQKLFYFCDFFCRTHFCVRHEANNYFFLRFFLRTTTPCARN